jgi:hypothetical protein
VGPAGLRVILPVRPNTPLRLATTVLWITPLVLQYSIAAAMLRRQLIRIFPIFFTYTVWVSARETALLFIRYPSNLYASVYLWGDALAVLLGIGVIVEAIHLIFPSHPLLRRLLRSVWIFAMIAAVMSLLLLISARASGPDPALEWILLLERSARLLQASMLVVVTAFMSRLGLRWHHYLVGIVVGFGVYSALDLAALEFRGHLHLVTGVTYALLQSSAYNLGAIIWAFYFLRPWRQETIDRLPETDLAEWNDAVTDHIKQWYRPS